MEKTAFGVVQNPDTALLGGVLDPGLSGAYPFSEFLVAQGGNILGGVMKKIDDSTTDEDVQEIQSMDFIRQTLDALDHIRRDTILTTSLNGAYGFISRNMGFVGKMATSTLRLSGNDYDRGIGKFGLLVYRMMKTANGTATPLETFV